jgi:hypothetical protein
MRLASRNFTRHLMANAPFLKALPSASFALDVGTYHMWMCLLLGRLASLSPLLLAYRRLAPCRRRHAMFGEFMFLFSLKNGGQVDPAIYSPRSRQRKIGIVSGIMSEIV